MKSSHSLSDNMTYPWLIVQPFWDVLVVPALVTSDASQGCAYCEILELESMAWEEGISGSETEVL